MATAQCWAGEVGVATFGIGSKVKGCINGGCRLDQLGLHAIPDIAAALTRLAAGLGQQATVINGLPPARHA